MERGQNSSRLIMSKSGLPFLFTDQRDPHAQTRSPLKGPPTLQRDRKSATSTSHSNSPGRFWHGLFKIDKNTFWEKTKTSKTASDKVIGNIFSFINCPYLNTSIHVQITPWSLTTLTVRGHSYIISWLVHSYVVPFSSISPHLWLGQPDYNIQYSKVVIINNW